MTPAKIRERLREADGEFDVETYYGALQYVRDDGRARRRRRRQR
ncbi:hypothetical protein [Halosimplex salinum]|nr:hypothetical protein [Halosimplex salinum]